MAPTHSRFTLNNPRLTIFAKKAGGSFPSFGLGKTKQASSSNDVINESSGNSKLPFSFESGKIFDGKSVNPIGIKPSPGLVFIQRRKEPKTVFVAGATGQAGIRIAQTLLREGFNIRAVVPDIGAAHEYCGSN